MCLSIDAHGGGGEAAQVAGAMESIPAADAGCDCACDCAYA